MSDIPSRRPARGSSRPGPPRVLLVESLDATGSDRADARERSQALRALGAVVRTATLEPGPAAHEDAGAPGPGATVSFGSDAAGLSALGRFAREGHFDLTLVAATAAGGGPAGQVLEPAAARWWPTGLPGAPGWGSRLALRRAPALPVLAVDGVCTEPETPAGIAWSSLGTLAAGRRRLTLWDGDYLLAPLPLAGDDGSRVVAVFAGLAAEWSGLDLVVLSAPQPRFEREARARGMGARVHFVGPAPREAEWAWWAHAAAAVLAGRGPVAGGLLLRGLASGCPLVVASSDAPGVGMAQWLAVTAYRDPALAGIARPLAAALERALARDGAVEAALTRGRALAARHEWRHLAPRLAAALPVLDGARRSRGAAAA